MQITQARLREIVLEELDRLREQDDDAPEAGDSAEVQVVDVEPGEEPAEAGGILEDSLKAYAASLRALQLWTHSAHNLTKGTGFVGDHIELFGNFYPKFQDDYDTTIEKTISLTGDEMVGCPIHVTERALEIIRKYPSPAGAGEKEILEAGLKMIQDHYDLLTDTYGKLEDAGQLPLGLDDFLAASADDYDKFVYLLQQRLKGAAE